MINMSKDTNKKWAVGALIAGVVGFLAGILTAPKSGKETREDLKNTANRVVSEAEKQLKRIHSEMNVVIDDAKEILSGKSGKAKEDIEKALNVAKDKQSKVKSFSVYVMAKFDNHFQGSKDISRQAPKGIYK
jgi:gas vesicle protein